MASENPSIIQKAATLEFILLLQDMLVHTAPSALLHPLGEPGSQPQRPYELAASFYGITSTVDLPKKSRKPQPVATITEDIFSITFSCATVSDSSDTKQVSMNHAALSRATKLLDDLLEKTTAKQKIQFSVVWDTEKWRDKMLDCLEQVSVDQLLVFNRANF
jgi:hypothetical protein